MVTWHPEHWFDEVQEHWLLDLQQRRQGETAGEHVVRIVRACKGISLDRDADKLAALFVRNETSERQAKIVSTWITNCGTFYRQALYLAGCVDLDIIEPYICGKAVEDDQEAAQRAKAVRSAATWRSIVPGAGLLYWRTGNDAHIEIALGTPDVQGVCEHGGGGRARNAITIETSTILSSHGRPLRAWFDPEPLCTVPVTGDDPYL